MKRFIFLFLIVILIFSCDDKKISHNSSISGKITNLKQGDQLFLDYLTPSKIITKDTAFIDSDGNYNFDHQIQNLGYYRLRINNQNFINLVLNIGSTAIINSNGNNLMDTYIVNGSDESNRLKQFNWAYKVNALIQDSLSEVHRNNPNDQHLFTQLQISKFSALAKMNGIFQQLIDEKPGSLVSLAAIQQLDQKSETDRYQKVDKALAHITPNNPWYINFHKKLKNFNLLYIGEPAPDFTLTNLEGKSTSLSSLKGKVILVDFWASWCRPCRAENPNLVKAYAKYKNKGFDILSVSLDGMPQQQDAKQDWLNAIEKDNLTWKNHVSDLKGWNSSVVPTFNIKGIPFTLLVDNEGFIIGVNLRGEALEKKLEQIF